MARKVQTWIFWRRARTIRVLVLKTRKDRGGFWQPVTGGVEKGESLKAAAFREAKEETGLRFKEKPRSLKASFRFVSRWGGRVSEHAFALEAPGRIPPRVRIDRKEHVRSAWVTPSEARRKIRYPSNKKILGILVHQLNRFDKESSSWQ